MSVAIDDRLTRCERAGNFVTFVNPSPAERDAIALHFGALRAQGHAVVADEVQHEGRATELRIHHYKTCMACCGVAR